MPDMEDDAEEEEGDEYEASMFGGAADGGVGGLQLLPPGVAPITQAAAADASPLGQLRLHPQFDQLRSAVQANPAMLQAIIEQIGGQSPEMLAAIQVHDAQNRGLGRKKTPANHPLRPESGLARPLALHFLKHVHLHLSPSRGPCSMTPFTRTPAFGTLSLAMIAVYQRLPRAPTRRASQANPAAFLAMLNEPVGASSAVAPQGLAGAFAQAASPGGLGLTPSEEAAVNRVGSTRGERRKGRGGEKVCEGGFMLSLDCSWPVSSACAH